MKIVNYIVISLSFLLVTPGFTQKSWTLEQCLERGLKHSLIIRQSQINLQEAELNFKQSHCQRLPTINSGIQTGFQFGRTINPTTNDFDNQRIGYNTLYLEGNVPIYKGNSINKTIEQRQFEQQANERDVEVTKRELSLDIASAYLNILLAEEQLEYTRQQLDVSSQQLDQTQKLIAGGLQPKNDLHSFETQVAKDEQRVTEAENNLVLNYLNLEQILELEPGSIQSIERPDLPVPQDETSLVSQAIIRQAIQGHPQVQADEARIQGAKAQVSVAQAGRLPTVSLYGSLNSNFSSINSDLIKEQPYFQQLNDNFGQNVGIDISIPIYNNCRIRTATEKARLNVIRQQTKNKQSKQQLWKSIQSAVTDVKGFFKTSQAAQRAASTANLAYEDTEKRYQLGLANAYELAASRNEKYTAELEALQSKYRFHFSKMILQHHLGRPLNLVE